MKLIKCLNFNSLLFFPIKNKISTNNIIKYSSIKNTKKIFFNNNIYFDLYNDFCDINSFCNYETCDILNKKQNKYIKYSSLTAEHIFPQSYIKEYNKANLDMHNIFLTTSISNSHRSNYKYYDEFKYNKKYKNKLIKITNNNYKNSIYKIYIPCHYIRGIIARSVAYMKYKYPNLNTNNVLDYELIIKWNLLYPPTTIEIERNNIIKQIQGNDNPFITYYNKIYFYTKPISFIYNLNIFSENNI